MLKHNGMRRKLALKNCSTGTLILIKKSILTALKCKTRLSIVISVAALAFALYPAALSKITEIFTNAVISFAQNEVSLYQVLVPFLIISVMSVANAIFGSVHSYCEFVDKQAINRHIRETILGYITRVEYNQLDNHTNFREKIEFISQHGGDHVAGSIQKSLMWLQQIITIFSLTYIIWDLSPAIFAILIVTSIPAAILAYVQNDEDYRSRVKWSKSGAMLAESCVELIDARHIAEINFLKIQPYLKKKWRETATNYLTEKNALTAKHVKYNSGADILRSGVYLAILLITAQKIYRNPVLGVGVFMLAYTATSQFQKVITELLVGVADFFSDIKYMKDYFSLEELPMEDMVRPRYLPKLDIEFKDVTFTYPGADTPSINHLNLKIKQGERIALIGENGAGKSTLVNLLCGFYKPDDGEILINGINLEQIKKDVRASIAVIFQDYNRYETTLRQNIMLNYKEDDLSLDEFNQVIQKTGVAEIATAHKNGLDEALGRFSEYGTTLSAGQWQKVAVARGFCRPHSSMIILDEPTAAMDPMSESDLYENMQALISDKTAIIISHRLGVCKTVERIIVLQDGKIIEDGSHNSLIKLNGKYATMYNAQQHAYTEQQISCRCIKDDACVSQ